MPNSANRHPKTVRDLMTAEVITIDPDSTVARAAVMLAESHVSALAVVDHHHHLIGVLSASDIVNAEVETANEPTRDQLWSLATVRDIMTHKVVPVSPDLELREAALQMDYLDVHRLFVLEDGRLVGVISRSDINHAFAAGTLH